VLSIKAYKSPESIHIKPGKGYFKKRIGITSKAIKLKGHSFLEYVSKPVLMFSRL